MFLSLGTLYHGLKTLEVGKEVDFEPDNQGTNPYSVLKTPTMDTTLLRYILIGISLFIALFVLAGSILMTLRGDDFIFKDLVHRVMILAMLLVGIVLLSQIAQVLGMTDALWFVGSGAENHPIELGVSGGGALDDGVRAMSPYAPVIIFTFLVVIFGLIGYIAVKHIILPQYEMAKIENVNIKKKEKALTYLNRGIKDLSTGMDIRSAIIYCYLQMEELVSRKKNMESDTMTPEEFKKNAREVLEIEGRSLDNLTDLFLEARYSKHPLSEEMRKEAIRSLTDFKENLEVITRTPSSN